LLDIGGKKDLELEAMVELLKRFEEKENLFANFPIGATIQDGGKRKRSNALFLSYLILSTTILIKL